MKWKTSKDLLIILISLFILQSCKKEGSIGLEDQLNETGIGVGKNDTSSIIVWTVKDDTLISSNYARNLLGELIDPVFGETRASIAFHATLSKNNVSFGTTPTLDSIVMVMGYIGDTSQRFYGDKNSIFNISVSQLDETISNDSIYYSNKKYKVKSTEIGSVRYRPNPKDSLIIQNIIDNKKDTVMKVYPQIRIKLTDDFGKELLAKSGLVDLSDNTAFLNAYKGFYLTAKNLSGNGGVMSFDLTNANRSYIILYYKNTTDTSNFIFNINSVAANVNRYEHDYSNTKVQYQFTDTVQGQQNAYAQSLAGTRVRIRFPDLELRKDSNKIAINKAELIIPIETGSDSKFAPISTLSLKARRKGSSAEYLISSGVYDASKKQYTIEMTKTVQQFILNRLDFQALYLEDASKQIKANRSILNGPKHPSRPIRLAISYSKL
jgi:hypothetical protein